MIAQNLKGLILTSPGERVMDPNFGVGLKGYLFEQNTGIIYAQIKDNIRDQVSIYLPFIDIIRVNFLAPDNTGRLNEVDTSLRRGTTTLHRAVSEHTLSIEIVYRILPLDVADALIIKIDLAT